MSFPVLLQYNASPPNYFTKTLTDVATATGTLRSSTSISSPTITIDSELASDLISNINYMYIAQFNRYYYINNISIAQNHLWVIDAHVDVLMSFKDAILANKAIIKRQESVWNLYLDDGSFHANQDPLVQAKLFPNGFDTYSYVLAVAGAQNGSTST